MLHGLTGHPRRFVNVTEPEVGDGQVQRGDANVADEGGVKGVERFAGVVRGPLRPAQLQVTQAAAAGVHSVVVEVHEPGALRQPGGVRLLCSVECGHAGVVGSEDLQTGRTAIEVHGVHLRAMATKQASAPDNPRSPAVFAVHAGLASALDMPALLQLAALHHQVLAEVAPLAQHARQQPQVVHKDAGAQQRRAHRRPAPGVPRASNLTSSQRCRRGRVAQDLPQRQTGRGVLGQHQQAVQVDMEREER